MEGGRKKKKGRNKRGEVGQVFKFEGRELERCVQGGRR